MEQTEERKARVLVVDDEETIRDVLVGSMSNEDFEIVSFATTREAISYAHANPVDVILTDLNFPDGESGHQMVTASANLSPSPEVIVISGRASPDDTTELAGGTFGFLMKPFRLDKVALLVQAAIEKAQSQRDLDDSIRVLKAEKSRLSSVVAERTDGMRYALTRLKNLEKVKSTFMKMASHALRTPTTAVIGTVELFKATATLGSEDQHILEQALTEAWRLHRIVNDILQVTQLTVNLDQVYCDVKPNELVDRCLDQEMMKIEESGVTVRNLIPREYSFHSDPGVEDALQRVISNAVNFAPGGNVDIWVAEDRCYHTICVSDDGEGLKEEALELLMTAFEVEMDVKHVTYQFGLGLPVARAVMDKIGGRLRLESEGKGKGCTAFLDVPISKSHPFKN